MPRVLFSAALACAGGLFCLLASAPAPALEPAAVRAYVPKIAAASNEATLALRRIHVPDGLRISLFAAEPMLANPVCFCIDEKNRFYVAETFRLGAGVTDIRSHMDWLDDDLACQTVADRVTMYRKHLRDKFDTYTVHHDRIRLIEDTDGDGVADRATVFADGFHDAAEGIGAGLLARGANVWYACIPDLWLLRDPKRTGKAQERKSLHHGYGVHVGFIGHDLHGLRMGPDGKLYFSIGDRGLNVSASGRTVTSLDSGAVLRCNPDGSELEIVATGLRNPQELAFDQYGNLFTGDNNADGGDKARWVWVVEGGDSGWRLGYQFMSLPTALGPWNAEKLWHPAWDGQAAYLVPPIANVADGPAGLAYYPGVGLPERYREHFFLCDFRGGSGNSGIRSFAVKPKGAAFEMVDQHECIWSVLATDVDFGTDGALYFSDWVEGWEKPHKGRIYRVVDPAAAKDPVVQGVKKLLADGMTHRSVAELAGLLEHPDQRVRQEAQFALAEKGTEAVPTLRAAVAGGKHQLARLHAIWALGQIGRKQAMALQTLPAQLADPDPEIRAQAVKVLGDHRPQRAGQALPVEQVLPLLKDTSPRVRFFAALALGKARQPRLGRGPAVAPAIVEMLRDNDDKDPYLRHAGVMALAGLSDLGALHQVAKDPAPGVRLAALLAWRRLGSDDVAQFLNDKEPRLVLEAARAINDVPIPWAFADLAALSSRKGLAEPLLHRVLNANFRLGQAHNAAALAAVAARADVPEALRLEALRMLGQWQKPSGRDRIVGLWRPLDERPVSAAADALRPRLGDLFRGPDGVCLELARAAGRVGLREASPLLHETLVDQKRAAPVRVAALKALAALKDEQLPQAMKQALADVDPKVRLEGLRLLADQQPEEAIGQLAAVLGRGTTLERQGALSILAGIRGRAANDLLLLWLGKLQAGEAPPEIQLDLLEAAAKRPSARLKQKLEEYEAARPKNDPLAKYREALAGGDAEAGRRIFFHKAEVSCLRCHKVKGEGGEVGPDLAGIGTRQKREYILESIVDPNKEIAKGYETVLVELKSGQIVVGVLREETATELRLLTAEGKPVTVAKSQVEERTRGKSVMPEDVVKHLSRRELRDLVEFLAGLR
jgi:quinoprotein glucose dehydrogenase